MNSWTLEKVKSEVRLITGVYYDDVPEHSLEEIIQHFWRVTLPATLKLEGQKGTHRFLTRKGQSVYPMPNTFITLNPPAFLDHSSLHLTYDDTILSTGPGYWYTELVGTGNQTQDIFSKQLGHYPDVSSICIFTPTEEIYWGDSRLSYLYEDKLLTVDFRSPPPAETQIFIKYRGESLGIPYWLLVQDHTLTLVPTPGSSYMVEVAGRKRPDPLPTEGPFLKAPLELMDLLVYGSALRVFSLTDASAYQRFYPLYSQAERSARAKTNEQLLYTPIQGL